MNKRIYWFCLIFFGNVNIFAKQSPTPQQCTPVAQHAITDYMLIDNGSHFDSNFEFVPKHVRFTLVTTEEGQKGLTATQKLAFDKIIILPYLSFKHVLKAIKTSTHSYQSTKLMVLNENLALMVAKISAILGIPGPTVQAMLPFCDKLISKRRLNNSSVHYPRFMVFDYHAYCLNPSDYISSVISELGLPIVVKPNNLSGANGVKKINSANELFEWCNNHSQGRKIIEDPMMKKQANASIFEFEEYIASDHADLFHCDSIIQNGKICFTQVSMYTYPLLAVVEGKPIGSITLHTKDHRYKLLRACSEQVIQAFRRYAPIPDGIMHLEAFYDNKAEKVIFLETQLRYPGLETPLAYKIHLNIDIEEIHWKLQMGLPVDCKQIKKGPFAMWVSIPTQNGTIDAIELPNALKSKIHRVQYRIEKGYKTSLPEALTLCDHCKKIALRLLISSPNYDHILSDFNYLKYFQPFKMENKIA
ncbi:MAG: hypothetical protein NQ127_01215 [Candidatus Cardinium sp.]|nr:hypothetical protein [Candidatus Cardinium sp.]